MIDTLRQDRVSAYGYSRETTPFLDRLAREGARADGVSPTPWTKAATATLLTGLHPLRHQAFSESDVIPAQARTLAERLSAAGYRTLGLSTNGWVSRAWGFDRGFDEFVSLWRLGYGKFASSRDLNLEVEKRLGALEPPYFLYLHYLDPHMPYAPPYGWDGEPLPEALARHVPFTPEDYGVRGVLPPEPEKVAIAKELYDGEVRANDDALAAVLGELEARGLLEETLVVVTSDHGEEFGEHGRVGHGQALYQESVAVPLVFRAPGVVRPGSVLGRVGLEDVVPTVLDLLGLGLGPVEGTGLDGQSVARSLRGGGELPPDRGRLLHVDFRWGAALGWLQGGRKLVLADRPAYAKELLDLRRDPGEQENLLRAPAADVEADFAQRAETLAIRYQELLRGSFERKTTTADEELVAQIQALGYVQSFTDRSVRRSFPRRLSPATPVAGGLRGWENLERTSSCLHPAEESLGQLLAGWHAAEPALGGRWSYPESTVWFPRDEPAVGFRLTIEGENYSPLWRTLTVDLGPGAASASVAVEPGPVRLALELTPAAASAPSLLLRLRIDPPYLPPEHGIEDFRPLGLFVRELCLEPDGSPPDRAGQPPAGPDSGRRASATPAR